MVGPEGQEVDDVDHALHPWNTGFTWDDHTGPFEALTPDQAAKFDRDGFFSMPDVLNSRELEQIVTVIDCIELEKDNEMRSLPSERDDISQRGSVTFTGSLVCRSEQLARFAREGPLVPIAHDLLGPDIVVYWDQAVYKKSEVPRRFPWHQDNGYVFVEPQAFLTFWIALTDATVESGCPVFVPGLHRRGTLRHHSAGPLGYECFSSHPLAVAVEVPAGSAVAFSSLTPHMTGPNTTGSMRRAYILQYAVAAFHRLSGDPESDEAPTRAPCRLDRQLRIPAPDARAAR